jgi:cytochrome c biogenesis protein CcmG/thiol:disulfide interchange protein DsbE
MSDTPATTNQADTRTPWLRRAAWTAVVVVLGVAAAFGTRLGLDPGVVDSPLLGQPAPDVALPRLDGPGTVALSDLRGQVVVVNFWASWCVPCREENDDLLAAAARYDDVTFLGIVYQDTPQAARAFLDELGQGYDHLLDPGSRAAIDFGVFGIPETFFIDPDGTVAAKIIGTSDLGVLSATLDAVIAGEDPQSIVLDGYQSQR